MNRETVSAECAAKICSPCAFEDCACECHLGEEKPVRAAMTYEEYVRSKWEESQIDPEFCNEKGGFLWCVGDGQWFQSWTILAAFTRDREEEIRQIREEIALLKCDIEAMRRRAHNFYADVAWMVEYSRWCRILASRESALAELKQGWKEPS